ncbi:hypothetical protein BH11MYX4_BH11MYX4_56430 [soil metagenome]
MSYPHWPLLRLANKGAVFGIRGGEWVAVAKDGLLATIEEAPHAFLALLEIPQEAADALVLAAALEANVAPESLPPFPHQDVIVAGLRSASAYWEELALARLGRQPSAEPWLEELRRLAVNGATQAIRHEARRLSRGHGFVPPAGQDAT